MKYQIKEIKNKFDQDFCAANAALKKSVHTGIQKKNDHTHQSSGDNLLLKYYTVMTHNFPFQAHHKWANPEHIHEMP